MDGQTPTRTLKDCSFVSRSRQNAPSLQIATALKEEEINAHCFKLGNAFRNLGGRTHESRTQSPVTDGVIFERNMLVESRTGQPLLIVVVAGGGLLHIGNACQFSFCATLSVSRTPDRTNGRKHSASRSWCRGRRVRRRADETNPDARRKLPSVLASWIQFGKQISVSRRGYRGIETLLPRRATKGRRSTPQP
jgi:hypothetical protein